MDFTAIKQAKGEEVQTIGQLRKGDVLALRAFVEGKPNKAERDEKRKLLQTLKGKLPRKKSKSKSKIEKAKEIKEDPKIAHRKVLIGWQHFDKAKICVCMWWSCDISVPMNSTRTEIIEQNAACFFS